MIKLHRLTANRLAWEATSKEVLRIIAQTRREEYAKAVEEHGEEKCKSILRSSDTPKYAQGRSAARRTVYGRTSRPISLLPYTALKTIVPKGGVTDMTLFVQVLSVVIYCLTLIGSVILLRIGVVALERRDSSCPATLLLVICTICLLALSAIPARYFNIRLTRVVLDGLSLLPWKKQQVFALLINEGDCEISNYGRMALVLATFGTYECTKEISTTLEKTRIIWSEGYVAKAKFFTSFIDTEKQIAELRSSGSGGGRYRNFQRGFTMYYLDR